MLLGLASCTIDPASAPPSLRGPARRGTSHRAWLIVLRLKQGLLLDTPLAPEDRAMLPLTAATAAVFTCPLDVPQQLTSLETADGRPSQQLLEVAGPSGERQAAVAGCGAVSHAHCPSSGSRCCVVAWVARLVHSQGNRADYGKNTRLICDECTRTYIAVEEV